MSALLLHCHVKVSFGRFSLEARFESTSQSLAIFGPSGAGKTTLVEAICGLVGAEGCISFQGETWLDSSLPRALPARARAIGYVPQHGLLFPELDVRENLSVGRRRAERSGRDFVKTFEQVISVLELSTLLSSRVDVLSGGERQRVALGRALCSGPRLLVLDEPLSSLDLPLRRRLLPFLRRVREEFDVPMLLVSHDPVEVQALADEVIVLREGRVVSQGAPRSLSFVSQGTAHDLAEGFENIWPVVCEQDGESMSVLRAQDRSVIVRGHFGPKGRGLLVSVEASSVLIATEQPRGLSAANVWPATITDLVPKADAMLLALAVDGAPLPFFAEVLASTAARLDLVCGKRVFAIVKSSSCRLFDERGG